VNRLLIALITTFLLMSVSCGEIFVRGAINTTTQSTSGTVSIVQFAASSGTGISVTIITLISNNSANTFNFCGDERAKFPMAQAVQVSFVPGTACASIVAIEQG
jgi:V8-like Glu-specific endopeptidase